MNLITTRATSVAGIQLLPVKVLSENKQPLPISC